MAVTTTNAEVALKSYYLPAITDQLDKSISPFFARIRKTTTDVSGKEVRKLVRYGMNGGISAGTETGELPGAGPNSYAVFYTPLKNFYGTIEISDKAIRASATEAGAFVSLLNDEMNGLIESASFNFNRMLFGDGTGKLATINGNASFAHYYVDSVKNLIEGMVVDVVGTSGSVIATSRTIETVDREKKIISLSGSDMSSPANYTLVVQDSKDLELTGLGCIFRESGSLYGQRIENSHWLKPNMYNDIGDIDEMKIQTAIDEVEERTGSKINFIMCSWGVRRALFNVLSKSRVLEPMTLEGGFKALNFNGIPVVADRFCPEGTMYLLNTDDFAIHQLCDWQWLEGEDGKILKQVAGKPVFTATLVKYADLMCYRPAGQAMLSGITEA